MWCVPHVGWLWLLSSLTALLVACSVSAEDKKSKEEDLVYTAEIHGKEGKVEEKTFNLTKNAGDVKVLAELLSRGEIEHLAKEKKVNPLNITWDLGLWTLVVFGLLFFFLKKLAWKPILEGLHKREESIVSAVEEAKRARDETERVRAEFQRELAKAHEQIPEIIGKARRDAERLGEELRAKALAENQAERERLHREIAMARDQALQELWNQAAQLATLISAKAIQRTITTEDHRRLVDEALAELRSAGQQRQRLQ